MPGFDVNKIMTDLFLTMFSNWLDGFFSLVSKLIFAPQALPKFANDMYNIFLATGATLMTAIVATRLIQLLFDISNDNAQTTVGELIGSTVKASAMVFLCPLLIKLIVGDIAYPLGDYMFSQISENTSTAVKAYITSSGLASITSGFMLDLLVGFIALAVIFFFFKMCVYQVDIIFLQIYSVYAACTMCAGENNYMGVWWREVLSQVVTILTQVLCMVGVTWAMTAKFEWYNFMILVGCCVNLIRGPKFLHSMWYSTGTSQVGGKIATRIWMMKNIFK